MQAVGVRMDNGACKFLGLKAKAFQLTYTVLAIFHIHIENVDPSPITGK